MDSSVSISASGSGISEKDKKSVRLCGNVMIESVKMIAESIGVGGLHDDALQLLADDATYRLKQTLQDSVKFMHHGKRTRLTTVDFDHALKIRNVEPLYGFHAQEYIPFRHASGAGREIHFIEDKEFDLKDIVGAQLPKIPLDVSLKSHWLVIDGEQPAVPENPPPIPKDLLKLESMDPSVKVVVNKPKPKMTTEFSKMRSKAKVQEKVRLKELTSHELSTEQQLYYKEITEACVGSDETRRQEALQSLSNDTGMHQMLPRFSTFILEGVKVNIVQNNLALLIYLMRMAKSLLDNPTLYLEKYLHELIPALMSCIVSKQLCLRPDVDNHWALRDFASRLLAQLCRMFGSSTNNVQVRITRMLSTALQADTAPLATHYGAIIGLGELGTEVIKSFVLPYVRTEADRLQFVIENTVGNSTDRTAADHVKQAILKVLPPALKTLRMPPDIIEEYNTEFGYLGAALHAAVVKLRQTTPATTASPFSSSSSSIITSSLMRSTITQQKQPQFTTIINAASAGASLRGSGAASSTRLSFVGSTTNVPATAQPTRLLLMPKASQPSVFGAPTTRLIPTTSGLTESTSSTKIVYVPAAARPASDATWNVFGNVVPMSSAESSSSAVQPNDYLNDI